MSSQAPAKSFSRRRTTTLLTRQTHCTHSTFTREFNDYDRLATCQMCKRGPDIGWVYACTEDEERLYAKDEYPQQPLSSITALPTNFAAGEVVQMNAWIEKAVEDGHYTPEQVELVKLQRAAVLETINTDNCMRHDITPETQSYLSNQETENSGSAPEKTYVKFRSSALLPACHGALGNVTIPTCRLRVCPGCMPTATERSWQSLDQVCGSDYMTNDRLLETLADVAASIKAACLARGLRKVPSPDGSPSFDVVDAHNGGDENRARGSTAMTSNYPSNHGHKENNVCVSGLDEGDMPPTVDVDPVNKVPTKKKSLRELLHLHRNQAKGMTMAGKNNNHGRQSLCIPMDGSSDMTGSRDADADRRMAMEVQQQHKASENTRRQQSRIVRPGFARRAKYEIALRHRGSGNDGEVGDLGFVSIDRLMDPADRDVIIARA